MAPQGKKNRPVASEHPPSEELLRVLFLEASDGIVIVDAAGHYLEVNARFCEMMGYSRREALKLGIADLVPADDLAKAPIPVAETRHGESVIRERRLLRKDGTFLPVEINIRGLSNGNLLGFIRDITSRKKTEETLRRTQATIENSPDALYWIGLNGALLHVNATACAMSGYTREELLSMTVFDIDPEMGRERWNEHWQRVRQHGSEIIESVHRTKDNRFVPVEIVITVLQFEGAEYHCSFARDITVRKQAADKLRRSEERLRGAQAVAHVGNWEIDLLEQTIWASEEAFQIYGLERTTEFLPLTAVQEHVVGPDRPRLNSALQNLVRGEGEYDLEFQLHRASDKSLRWIHSRAELVRDHKGNPLKVIGVIRDITGRKNTEEALSRANRHLRMLSGCDEALIHVADESQLLSTICRVAVEVGRYTMAWVGYVEDDPSRKVRPMAYAGSESGYLQGADITWSDTERGRGPIGTAIRTGQPSIVQDIEHETQFAPWCREAAERGYASVCAVPMLIGGRTFGALGIYSSTPDSFDAKEVEILSELAVDMAYGVTVLRARTERNRAEKALQESEELYRKLVTTVPDVIIRTDLQGNIVYVNEQALQVWEFAPTENILGKNVFSFIASNDKPRALENFRLIVEKSTGPQEYRVVLSNGTELDCEINGNALRDFKGEPNGMVFVIREISERKRTEAALRSSLHEKDLLLKEIHHRVKNNLQIISSLLNMQSNAVRDENLRPIFLESQNRIKTMARVHEQLYRSRNLSVIDLGEQIRDLTTDVGRSYAKPGIKVVNDVQSVFVGIDLAIPIGLIANELVTNALKHAFPYDAGGCIFVSLRRSDLSHIELKVQDNGVGFPPDRDFKKMSTLGMTLVTGLAEQISATLSLEGAPGTTFRLCIPV